MTSKLRNTAPSSKTISEKSRARPGSPLFAKTAGKSNLFGTATICENCGSRIPIDSRTFFDLCCRLARQLYQNDFNTERNASRLLSVERAPMEDDERAADHRAIVEDQQASSGTPRHHQQPTSEQRNSAVRSKDDEQAADQRAIVDSRETTPDSNPSSVSNRESQLQFFTSRQCSIETATILHAPQST